MFENLSVFENRYEELNMKLYDPAVAADRNLYRDLMKEHKEIEPIVEKYRALKKAEASLEDAEAILTLFLKIPLFKIVFWLVLFCFFFLKRLRSR